MTNQNPTETAPKTAPIVQDEKAQPDSEQPEVKKELSEEETAAVAGGLPGYTNNKFPGGYYK